MKILAQTNFFKPVTVYDSDVKSVPSSGNAFTDWLVKVIKPVVQVEAGGYTLYKTGEWYEPTGRPYLIGGIALALAGLAASIYIIRKV